MSGTAFSPWTFELIKILLKFEIVHQPLLNFINLMAQGKLLLSIWGTNKLIPFSKPNNGIRPIAIADTFYRITAKSIIVKLKDTIQETLKPVQLGVGTRNGASIISTAGIIFANQIINGTNKNSEKLSIMSLDMSNAFNSISRDKILTNIRKYLPQLETFFLWAYGNPSNLCDRDGNFICHSCPFFSP